MGPVLLGSIIAISILTGIYLIVRLVATRFFRAAADPRRPPPSLKAYRILLVCVDALLALLYLCVLWTTFLTAITAVWLIVFYLVEIALDHVLSNIIPGLRNNADLITGLQTLFSSVDLLLSNPISSRFLQTTLSSAQFSALQSLRLEPSSATDNICPSGLCLDLTSFEFLSDEEATTCICDITVLTEMRAIAGDIKERSVVALVGAVLMVIASAFALPLAASFARGLARDRGLFYAKKDQDKAARAITEALTREHGTPPVGVARRGEGQTPQGFIGPGAMDGHQLTPSAPPLPQEGRLGPVYKQK